MTELNLKILDSRIRITFESSKNSPAKRNILRMYGGYSVTDTKLKPEYSITVHDNYKYTFMRNKGKAFISFFEQKSQERIDIPNTVDSIQLDLLMRILIHDLARKKNMFILHTSAVLVGGKARVFIGRNGIGKSTIVKMLKKNFLPLCDDKIVIKKEGKRIFLYQVPYRETNNYKKGNERYPVGGFYVLKQDRAMRIRSIDLWSEHAFIARVCSEICVDNNRKKVLSLVFSLKNNLFELGFTKRSKEKLIEFFRNLENREGEQKVG